jgi:hypothetical protein
MNDSGQRHDGFVARYARPVQRGQRALSSPRLIVRLADEGPA